MIASMSAGQPNRSTTTIAFVRGVTRARIGRAEAEGVRLDVGEHRHRAVDQRARGRGAHRVGETMTSSPGPTPAPRPRRRAPEVAEFTLTACRTPKYASHSRSSFCDARSAVEVGGPGAQELRQHPAVEDLADGPLLLGPDGHVLRKGPGSHRRPAVDCQHAHRAHPGPLARHVKGSLIASPVGAVKPTSKARSPHPRPVPNSAAFRARGRGSPGAPGPPAGASAGARAPGGWSARWPR